jgi:hypothetical protein
MIDCQILLKKYSFDYLIFENSEYSLIYKLVCYIENFEIDATYKSVTDTIPKNINLDTPIRHKIETVVNNIIKVNHHIYMNNQYRNLTKLLRSSQKKRFLVSTLKILFIKIFRMQRAKRITTLN